jgi:hypothetical protein
MDQWCAHQKLDNVKMSVRSIISYIPGKQPKREESKQKAIINQLNILRSVKEKILNNGNEDVGMALNIDAIIAQLETEYGSFLDEK